MLESCTTDKDLFFARGDMFKYVLRPVNKFGNIYETLIEDITDVYNTTLPGENVTMKEKMDEFFLDYGSVEKEDGVHFYTAPWAIGQNGLIRNNEVWKEEWGTPNTTDELFEIMDKVKAENNYPFIYSKENEYWSTFYHIWFYQYEGYDAYTNFWNGIDPAGRENKPELFAYQGKLESLKVLERILSSENGYCSPFSDSDDFMKAQIRFLEAKNKIPLMCNGDWMNGELLESDFTSEEINIEMIKTPVISALGTKLGITDRELSAIIDYVDGTVTEEPSFTSTKGKTKEEVIKVVREARGMNITASNMHSCWIPQYSDSKDAAKKFIQLMATDEGIATFVKSSHGHILPYKYDYTTAENYMSPFLKSTNKLLLDSMKSTTDDERIIAAYSAKAPLWAFGGLSINGNGDYQSKIVAMLGANNAKDRKTAEEIFNGDYIGVKERWDSYLMNAGLN